MGVPCDVRGEDAACGANSPESSFAGTSKDLQTLLPRQPLSSSLTEHGIIHGAGAIIKSACISSRDHLLGRGGAAARFARLARAARRASASVRVGPLSPRGGE